MFGNISIWQLLIVLAIIVLLFGTKKLRGIGTDLGSAVKGFRSSIKDEPESEDDVDKQAQLSQTDTLKGDAVKTHTDHKQHTSSKDKV